MLRNEIKLPANNRMSRHAMCKLPASNRPKISIPLKSIPPRASGIVGQVRKVSYDISELQKNLAVESAARNNLEACVEHLKAETAEAKQLAEKMHDVSAKRRSNGKGTMLLLMKKMPCKSRDELDFLHEFIESRSSQWIDYLKLLGGNDFNSAIKNIINTIIDRQLQKQFSWSGLNTTKPSLKSNYKGIIDTIHLAMRDLYKDYSVVLGETKIQGMLRNASKCKR